MTREGVSGVVTKKEKKIVLIKLEAMFFYHLEFLFRTS